LHNKTSDKILYFLLLTCLALAIWGVTIFRLTIIDVKSLFIITAIGTSFAFIALKKIFKNNYKNLWIFFQSIIVGGGISYFSTLFLNQYFANKDSITDEFKIIKTGNLARGRRSDCSRPYAIIDFYGTKKQLVFYCNYEKVIMNFSKVLLTYKKGLFGFDIIEKKELKP
jgi:hypothetical protein